MSIEVACPHCGSLNHVHERLRGRRVKCPHCDGEVIIPSREASDSLTAVPQQTLVAVGASPALSSAVIANGDGSKVMQTRAIATAAAPVTAAASEDDEDDVLPQKLKPEDGELDMTPMVDVTFLLLIFFMITAAFSLQKSIESPRQESDKPSMNSEPIETEELDLVTVQINEFGSYLVMAPDWERETPGKQNLILALREAMGDGKTAMKLSIEVHEAAKLQALVDCMDAGTICDYGELKVTQVESFDE